VDETIVDETIVVDVIALLTYYTMDVLFNYISFLVIRKDQYEN